MAEVGEELLHLQLEAIELLARAHETIVPVGRILKVAGAAFGLLLYLWFAGVRNVDEVKERKRSRKHV